MSIIAVFDAGKSRLKFSVMAEDGTCVFTDSTPSRDASSAPGVIDVERAENFLVSALCTAGSRFAITHFVPVGHGAAAAWLNAGALAAPVMDYETPIPLAISDAYEAQRPDFSESFSPSLPLGLNLGRQLAWAQTKDASLAAPPATLVTWSQYWAWALSGVAASEISSLGCHTDLWAPGAAAWSGMAQSRGWHERFAKVTRADAVLGTAQGALARDAGLNSDCQIVCGAHDSNAALYAIQSAGLLSSDICLMSTGTWTVTMAPGAALDALNPRRDCLANVSVSSVPVPTCRFMGGVEYTRIAGTTDIMPDADTCAERVRCGSMALPCFANAGGPFSSQHGEIIGPPPGSAKESAALAALYFALVAAYEIALLGSRKTLVIEGAMTHNPVIPGLIAALTGAAVYICAGEAVSIGAARLAMAFDTSAALALTPVAPLTIPGLDAYADKWRAAITARDAAAFETINRRQDKRS